MELLKMKETNTAFGVGDRKHRMTLTETPNTENIYYNSNLVIFILSCFVVLSHKKKNTRLNSKNEFIQPVSQQCWHALRWL